MGRDKADGYIVVTFHAENPVHGSITFEDAMRAWFDQIPRFDYHVERVSQDGREMVVWIDASLSNMVAVFEDSIGAGRRRDEGPEGAFA